MGEGWGQAAVHMRGDVGHVDAQRGGGAWLGAGVELGLGLGLGFFLEMPWEPPPTARYER